MQGVTTAIIAFVFVCIVLPHLVKNRPQFYGALVAVIAIILLDALAMMVGPPGPEERRSGLIVFSYTMIALLQIGAIVLLFLSCGGLTVRELADDMARAYEVMRRGEEETEIIIPRTGQRPKQREEEKEEDEDEEGRIVYQIDDSEAYPPRGRGTAASADAEQPQEEQEKQSRPPGRNEPPGPRDSSLPLD